MATPDHERPEVRDMYRAIGRYMVEFSRLVFFMRSLLARRLAGASEDARLVDLALGQTMPTPLADAFFAICLEGGRLDTDERKIGRSLRSRVIEQVNKTRNDLAHGDWWVGTAPIPEISVAAPDPLTGTATLVRIKPAKEADTIVHLHLTSTTVDEWSEDLFGLTQLVAAFGSLALGFDTQHRVRDVFAIEEKRAVLRTRPDQWPPQSAGSSGQ